MARQGINTGTSPNSGTGDTLLSGGIKINENFSEVYTLLGDGTNLLSGIVTSIQAGAGITIDQSINEITITASVASTSNVSSDTLSVSGISTLGNVKIESAGIVTAVSGVVTYFGDGSNLTGILTSGSINSFNDITVSNVLDGEALIYDSATSQFVNSPVSNGGYEFTGGFSDRDTGQSGANDLGSFIAYPQSFVDDERWYRFGFSQAAQTANDVQYWGESNPAFDQTKGLFGGLHMPAGVTDLFDYSYNDAVGAGATVGYSTHSDGSLKYNAATGSLDFRQARVGDLALVRFDFNVKPQVANTTLEIAMIWSTRNANDEITFTFPLTGSPLFYGTGTVGRTFLTRPIITAYFASEEDVNARALLAIRADNQIQIAPLTTLVTLQR